MSTSDQTFNVHGDDNLIAARDINLYTQQENDFFELALGQYEAPRFPSPQLIGTFYQILRNQHMLILGGQAEVDKSDLARHVAAYLNTRLSQAHSSSMSALEWNRNADSQKLRVRIEKTVETTIFLLPEVSPRDLRGEELVRIQNLSLRHYIIISTDVPFEDWRFPAGFQQTFWQELLPTGLFSVDSLARALVLRLKEVQDVLPSGLTIGTPDQPLCGRVTPRSIAEQIQTFHRLLIFISFLRATRGSLSEESLLALVKKAASSGTVAPDRFIQEWYGSLDARARMLTLNASFLSGLFEDQFFAALELLVDQVWRRRDPQVVAFDYSDLTALSLFFELVETREESGSRALTARLPDQRILLLREAWAKHRRQIIAALPALTRLAQHSVEARSLNHELYGSSLRCAKLREAVGQTLSDLGVLSLDAVQPALIELAADHNMSVQLVAAQAMARWRYLGKDALLFNTLRQWQEQSYAVDLLDLFLQEAQAADGESPQTYVRATIALTVGRAARYDKPDQLAPQLITLFKQLAGARNQFVRFRFSNYTIPRVVERHLLQMCTTLRNMTEYVDLIWPIAASIAIAYREHERPTLVLRILESWRTECVDALAKNKHRLPSNITWREKLLATVALSYGEIDYSDGTRPLTDDEAFTRLNEIRKKEHPFVRSAVVIAIGCQAHRYFDRVEPLLKAFIQDVLEHEYEEIVRILVDIYADQYARLGDGDEKVSIRGRRYPVWLNSENRPPTLVEKAMLEWIADDTKPVAQQIAIWAYAEFARVLDQPIAQHIDRIKEQRRQAAEASLPATDDAASAAAHARQDWYVGWLVPRLATALVGFRYRAVIGGLLPEVLRRKAADPSSIEFVLERWKNMHDKQLKQLSACLTWAVFLAERRRWAQVALGLLAVLAVLLAAQLGARLLAYSR